MNFGTYMMWVCSDIWVFLKHVLLFIGLYVIIARISTFRFVEKNDIHHHYHVPKVEPKEKKNDADVRT